MSVFKKMMCLFKSPASLTLWTAARALVVVGGGGGVVVVVVVVGASVVVVGSGVVVVAGSGAVVVGSAVVTSFWPERRRQMKAVVHKTDGRGGRASTVTAV